MCGIAGYLGQFERVELEAMSRRIAHRGPDGEGIWLSRDGHAGLAHRRLSIIDLSMAANQPMFDDASQVVLIYNGELYNYRELREKLVGAGFQFRTQSDTEVLLKMYLWKGVDMLDALNGIFAFAIGIRARARFLLHATASALSHSTTQTQRGLLFSSEMKSFLEIPDVDWTVDHTALRA